MIDNCCDLQLTGFPLSKAPSAIYQMKSCAAPCEVSSFAKYTITTFGYCDMTTNGGGWIVIQRNKKGSLVNYNKNWTDYEKGFGDLNTEFWYGLAAMHCLTQTGQWEMRVDYQLNNKTWSYIHYNQFSVGSVSEEYPLTVGGFTGKDTNMFMISKSYGTHNGMKFTTPDNDNDKAGGNCAASNKSGWWYNKCFQIAINMQPPNVYGKTHGNVIFTEMKIRPMDCVML